MQAARVKGLGSRKQLAGSAGALPARADGRGRGHQWRSRAPGPLDGGSILSPRIGVLALQGDFAEHAAALRRADAEPVEVRLPADLEGLDGLIIPGGESTTIG
ncbi:MAG: hypothetical protein ACRDI2_16535, partial [Chloroflexota bacterium]